MNKVNKLFAELKKEDLKINKFNKINKNNTIEVISDKYKFNLLLRWRNHKGILNPAWQISLKELRINQDGI